MGQNDRLETLLSADELGRKRDAIMNRAQALLIYSAHEHGYLWYKQFALFFNRRTTVSHADRSGEAIPSVRQKKGES